MQNKKGFTLIELMIVVAIIAILAMIAVPMYQRYLERARNSAVQSNLKNLALAEETFSLDNQGYTSVMTELTKYGFRPDRNIRFSPIKVGTVPVDGEDVNAFSVAGKHMSSTKEYVYDNAKGTGVMEKPAGSGLATPTIQYSADGNVI